MYIRDYLMSEFVIMFVEKIFQRDRIAWLVIFPRFCGHRVTRQPPLLRTRRATDTGGDGLIPASTCQRSSRHTRCPSSFLDVTCFRSCLQPAVVAGRPWLH